ncbi:MAG: DUF1127 domain-containing protein [Paracoccaceae bacterium]
MAAFDTNRTQFPAAGTPGRIGFGFPGLLGSLAAWNDSRATRKALSRLSDRELEDIGLSRGDIDSVSSARTRG